MRYRRSLVRQRAQEVQRLQTVLETVLETANIKLSAMATDILGVSGRRMREALAAGPTDVVALADLAKGRLREKLPALRQALDGRLLDSHRLLLVELLAHIDFLEQALARVVGAIEKQVAQIEEAVRLLQTIPAVGRLAARTIVAEIGIDMTCLPAAKHLASWAGVCPGANESGGNRLSGQTTNGDPSLRTVLCEVAWGSRVRRAPIFFVSSRALPPPRPPAREGACNDRGGAQSAHHHLPHPEGAHSVQRVGGRTPLTNSTPAAWSATMCVGWNTWATPFP
jgi:transposase